MFIYLVAVVAALFLIFGLVQTKCLSGWLRSSVCCSLSLYNGLIRRPTIETLNNLENTVTTERPLVEFDERTEPEEFPTHRLTFTNKERLSDAILGEAGSRARTLSPPRYSYENLHSEEKTTDFALSSVRPAQPGTTQEVVKSPRLEAKDNVFESLKSSIERNTSPYSSMNTSQIYNMILKEKLKENAAKQKLLESERSKLHESLAVKAPEHVPSSSENATKLEENYQQTSSNANN